MGRSAERDAASWVSASLGVAPALTPGLAQGPLEVLLEDYRRYLRVERALCDHTCGVQRHLALFLLLARTDVNGTVLEVDVVAVQRERFAGAHPGDRQQPDAYGPAARLFLAGWDGSEGLGLERLSAADASTFWYLEAVPELLEHISRSLEQIGGEVLS